MVSTFLLYKKCEVPWGNSPKAPCESCVTYCADLKPL